MPSSRVTYRAKSMSLSRPSSGLVVHDSTSILRAVATEASSRESYPPLTGTSSGRSSKGLSASCSSATMSPAVTPRSNGSSRTQRGVRFSTVILRAGRDQTRAVEPGSRLTSR